MSEPYVPSGKEYDEGLPRRAPRTRVGRALSKVARRRRGPSRVHDLRTHVSDEVGEGRKSELKSGRREVLHERGSTVALPAAGTDKATAPELQDEVPGDTLGRRTSTQEPVVPARTRSAARLDAKTQRDLLLVVCASGDLERQPVVDLLRTAALDPSLGAAARESVAFLVSVAEGSDTWMASALPAEVGVVLTYARRVGLEDYRELLRRRAQADAALRELQLSQNAYPVLGRIAQLCRSGKGTMSQVRTMVGDWNAPVYVAHRHAINAAIAACSGAGPEMLQAPILAPAAVRVPTAERDVVHACVSRVSTSPVHERVVNKAHAELSAKATSDRALQQHADELGISLQQPARASRSGRKKVNVRIGDPVVASSVSADRTDSAVPKCRKCRVLPAERHGMCSGCSNYGD